MWTIWSNYTTITYVDYMEQLYNYNLCGLYGATITYVDYMEQLYNYNLCGLYGATIQL